MGFRYLEDRVGHLERGLVQVNRELTSIRSRLKDLESDLEINKAATRAMESRLDDIENNGG